MDFKKATQNYYFISFLFLFGALARLAVINKHNLDTDWFLIPWYDYLTDHGILTALGRKFTDYTPPYSYLLSIATLVPLKKLLVIKLMPILMDIINSWVVYKLVQLKYSDKLTPLLASAILWCLPTVMLNGAGWGQADSFYAGLLLMTIYAWLKDKPFLAVIAYSVAFSFKLQAVFFGPILVIMLFKPLFMNSGLTKVEVKLWHFALIPLVYLLMCLPTVLLGRSWHDVLTIYFAQAETYEWLSAGAPNFYALIQSNLNFHPAYEIGFIFAAIAMFTWIGFTVKSINKLSVDKLLISALASVALAPFLLPAMHERYFYPADLLSLIVAFYMPRYWFFVVGFQITSTLSYYPFLSGKWGYEIEVVQIAAILNIVLIAVLLKNQLGMKSE